MTEAEKILDTYPPYCTTSFDSVAYRKSDVLDCMKKMAWEAHWHLWCSLFTPAEIGYCEECERIEFEKWYNQQVKED